MEFDFDGESIVAERGEPLAFALIAADKLSLARSPKLHRPHGPYCLRAACDGCLARVDGEPNVFTCMTPCFGGERVETQNVLGSRKMDLLRATDWFFPQGIDHHHLLAGVPAASFVMQKLARHVAGLGRLPDETRPRGQARRLKIDVLVVGAGPAGIAVTRELAGSGLEVLLIDDGLVPGGSLLARNLAVPDLTGSTVWSRTTAAGVYERDVLLVRDDEAVLASPRALVLATGTHDGVLPFAGNDLPGVASARAGALLARHGIAIGRRVAVWGRGPYATSFLERTRGNVEAEVVPESANIAAEGHGRLTGVTVSERRGQKKRLEVDALLVEALGSPAFELAAQAGASVAFDATHRGYLPAKGEHGNAGEGLWCAGELAGTGTDPRAIEAQARAAAREVLRALSPR
ncbi:MAG TPA: 2Fe-2S iron-sulfur cluster-binding protein [Polyangiaceae bacterium]|nr:2Fe-2S iron-sulfur cluster-binding protein [Polyangiaceae bacterium]